MFSRFSADIPFPVSVISSCIQSGMALSFMISFRFPAGNSSMASSEFLRQTELIQTRLVRILNKTVGAESDNDGSGYQEVRQDIIDQRIASKRNGAVSQGSRYLGYLQVKGGNGGDKLNINKGQYGIADSQKQVMQPEDFQLRRFKIGHNNKGETGKYQQTVTPHDTLNNLLGLPIAWMIETKGKVHTDNQNAQAGYRHNADSITLASLCRMR